MMFMQVDYVQVPYEAAKQAIVKAIPEWQAEGVLELFRLIDERNPAAAKQTPDFKNIVAREPVTIEQWTAAVGQAFK